MPSKYFCAHCNQEFVPEAPDAKPRCPRCLRKADVEPAQQSVSQGRARRPWVLIVALVLSESFGTK